MRSLVSLLLLFHFLAIFFFFAMRPWHEACVFSCFFFLGSWIRGSLQEWQSQYGLGSYTLMCRKSKATPVFCFVAISNCQLSMNLQKHKQTESGKGRGCFCSLSGNICIYASIFPFSFLAFTIPRSCQYFASSFFRIRVGSSFRFVCVCAELCKSNGTYRCRLQYYCCNSAV